jgi:hypothetical protein
MGTPSVSNKPSPQPKKVADKAPLPEKKEESPQKKNVPDKASPPENKVEDKESPPKQNVESTLGKPDGTATESSSPSQPKPRDTVHPAPEPAPELTSPDDTKKKTIDYSTLEKPDGTATESLSPSRPEPRDTVSPEYSNSPEVKEKVLNRVGRKIGSITALDANTRAMTAELDGQDLPHVEAGDNVGSLANKVYSFLIEVDSDNKKLGKLGSEQQRLVGQYRTESEALENLKKEVNWSQDRLNSEAPSDMGQLDVAAINLEKGTLMLADAGARYVDNVEAKAKEFLDAWDKTEKNEAKKNTIEAINSITDLLTAGGIGGNAITQLATKEVKAGLKTVGEATNAIALRGGQIGDLLQAGWNMVLKADNILSKTVPDAVDEISTKEKQAGSALQKLVSRLRAYADEVEASKYEKLTGF